MQHFQATFFEMQRELEKSDYGVEGSEGVTVRCRKEEIQNDEAKEFWLDFTPCVDVPFWPDSGIEWYLRPRKRFQHKPTGTVYQWPPKELVTVGADEEGNPIGPQWIGSSLVPSGTYSRVHKST